MEMGVLVVDDVRWGMLSARSVHTPRNVYVSGFFAHPTASIDEGPQAYPLGQESAKAQEADWRRKVMGPT